MKFRLALLTIVVLVLSHLSIGTMSALSAEEKVTFKVQWYDVGKAALEGRPGVVIVEKGWQGLSEVNRVVYNDEIVALEQLEKWVRDSGTYIDTVPTKESGN